MYDELSIVYLVYLTRNISILYEEGKIHSSYMWGSLHFPTITLRDLTTSTFPYIKHLR